MTVERLFEILSRYAETQGMELNRDREFVLDIMAGLLTNERRYGYRSCPCRLASGSKEEDEDIICPCAYRDADVAAYGCCYCRLYVSKDWNEGKIAHVVVAERRPVRR